MTTNTDSAAKRAIRSLGGQRKAATLLGVSQQAVSRWCVRGYAPPVHAAKLAALTDEPVQALVSQHMAGVLSAMGAGGTA